MGRFALDKAGIEKIRSMLKHQVSQTQKKLACETYDFFLNFAYKKSGGGVTSGGGGWTFYYLANWNVGINEINETVSPPEREPWGDDGDINYYPADLEKALRVTNSAKFGDSISVTNSVEYGPILNDGGVFGSGENKNSFCVPNRFIEQCRDHIEQNAKTIIEQVAKECPEL